MRSRPRDSRPEVEERNRRRTTPAGVPALPAFGPRPRFHPLLSENDADSLFTLPVFVQCRFADRDPQAGPTRQLLWRITSAIGISGVIVTLAIGGGVSVAVMAGVCVSVTSVCVRVNSILAVAVVRGRSVDAETSAVAILSGRLQAERINTPIAIT